MGFFQRYRWMLGSLGAACFVVFIVIYLSTLNQRQKICGLEKKATLFLPLAGTHVFSPLSLPFCQFNGANNISYQEFESAGLKWKATALKTDSVGMLLAEISKGLFKEKLLPLISVVLDANGAEYLLLVGKEGQVALSSVKFLLEHFQVNIKGNSSVEVRLPPDWGSYANRIPFYLKVNYTAPAQVL